MRPSSVRDRLIPLVLVLAADCSTACSSSTPRENQPGPAAAAASSASTGTAVAKDVSFGFPVGFSAAKMDTTASASKDFYRYSSGKWLDAARIPSDSVRIFSMSLLGKRAEAQLAEVFEGAAKASGTAAKGTPLQQVGDFYACGMDEQHLTDLGVRPLQPELDRIAALSTPKSIAEQLAHMMLINNEAVVVSLTVGTDTQDRTKYAIYAMDGELPMGDDFYLKPDAAALRAGYVKRIATDFTLSGVPAREADAMATKVLELETRVARKKLSAVDRRDPNKKYKRVPFSELRTLLSNVDVDAYLEAVGLAPQAEAIVVEMDALRERNAMLVDVPLADTKTYLRWELLKHTSPYLTPTYLDSALAFGQLMYGKVDKPPRAKVVAQNLQAKFGHPISQLYVARFFPAESKRAVEDLIGRVKGEFRTPQ